MSNWLQPSRLRDHAEYHAALRELEELFLCDPNPPAGHRIDRARGAFRVVPNVGWETRARSR